MKINLVCVISVTMMLLVPSLNYSQAPSLGTASDYAMFTSIGAFDNVGATTINGNIGTNAGLLTGFPPGTLVGVINVANPASAQTSSDVNVAYNYLVGVTCDVILTVLGNNQILTPNVYCLSAASTLTGDLILDGQGDPNALFILKIDGALSTDALSNVILINAALYDHVYWQVNGAFNSGTNSVFRGTVLANGAISMANGSAITGRVLTQQGAITLDKSTINNGNSPLPIQLISFTSKCEKQNAVLKWTTATEINNDYFSICRSVDASSWEVIGKVNGAGNSTEYVEYEFSDTFPSLHDEPTYYRLKQTDFDGRFEYSQVVVTGNCNAESVVLTLYPNPTNGTVFLNFQGERKDIVSTEIVNSLGITMYHADGYQSSFDLSVNSYGFYYIFVNTRTTQIVNKFMVAK